MSFTKGIATAIAGLSLVAVPVAASAAPSAAKLSVARASTNAAHGNKLGSDVGGSTLINIGILAALVAIVLVATDGGHSSSS